MKRTFKQTKDSRSEMERHEAFDIRLEILMIGSSL